jgi:hypothetical protein
MRIALGLRRAPYATSNRVIQVYFSLTSLLLKATDPRIVLRQLTLMGFDSGVGLNSARDKATGDGVHLAVQGADDARGKSLIESRPKRLPIAKTFHRDSPLNNLQSRLGIAFHQHVENFFVVAIFFFVNRVTKEKIDVIPHGIPDVAFIDPNFYKDQLGVEGKIVFVDLWPVIAVPIRSRNHGLSRVIALPRTLERHW